MSTTCASLRLCLPRTVSGNLICWLQGEAEGQEFFELDKKDSQTWDGKKDV